MSIVSFDWLKSELDSSSSNVMLLETSWTGRTEGYQNYIKKHIPSATYFDMWKGVNASHMRPNELADVKVFEQYCQSLGINNDSHVVIYDQGQVYFAGRLWFMFKAFGHENVSVLNGGIVFWEQQNLPLESGEKGAQKVLGNIQLKANTSNFFKNYDEMIKDADSSQLIDARHPDHFQGKQTDLPKELQNALDFSGLSRLDPDCMHRGHIPNAVNIHYPRFTDPQTRCFIPKEKLQEIYNEVGLDMAKPIIGTCYLGITACLIPLTASMMEKHGPISVYLGSWTEYSQIASADMVATGVASKLTNK